MTATPTELASDGGAGAGATGDGESDGDSFHRHDRPPSPLDGQVLLSDPGLIERSRRPGPIQRIRNVWQYRELLRNLTRLELKVKYKNSILGFFWSLLNPALYLAVFGIVFTVLIKGQNVPQFALFLLSGLLVWNFFSSAITAGAGSIVGNASLVTKVWFPREILPLASVGAAAFHLLLQSAVLLAALAIFHRVPSANFSPLLLPALVVLVLLTCAFAIALAAVNVYLRDTQHLLELVLVAWFWGSAIVYPLANVTTVLHNHGLPDTLTWINPVMPLILVFQRALYNPADTAILGNHGVRWYLAGIGTIGVVSIVLLIGALTLFGRLEDNFAEEI